MKNKIEKSYDLDHRGKQLLLNHFLHDQQKIDLTEGERGDHIGNDGDQIPFKTVKELLQSVLIFRHPYLETMNSVFHFRLRGERSA